MKVLVQFINDRSGSMQDTWNECLSGFKTYVEDLRIAGSKDSIDYFLSLTTFDTLIDQPLHQKALNKVIGNELVPYGPRGATALYDAVGQTIEKTDATGFDKIIVIIVTDGHENSSQEWKKDTLQKAIEAKINLGIWTFTYLGTQPETWDDASSLGIGVGAGATFSKAFTGDTYKVMAARTAGLSNSPLSNTARFMDDPAYVTAADKQEAQRISLSVNDGTTKSTVTVTQPPPIVTTPPQATQTPKQPEPPKKEKPGDRKWR